METWFLPVAAAVLYVLGGVFMKYADGLTRAVPSTLVFVFFCAGAALQTLAMRRADLGVAYVLVLGLEALFAFGLGVLLFKEEVTPVKVAAVGLVTLGIALLKR